MQKTSKHSGNADGSGFVGVAGRIIKQHWRIWILLAVAVSFGMSLWYGLQQSVWFDEAYSISLVTHSYSELVSLTAIDVHPPLYYLLLKFWSGVFGMSEVALRSFSALCGGLAVGIGLVLVRRLFGNRAMVFATPLVLLTPLLVRYGFELRMYVLGSLITLASTYVLVRATQATKYKIQWWITYSVLVAMGMYTLYFMAFVFAAQVVWLLYMHFARKSPETSTPLYKQPWVIAFVGAIVLYLPWIPTFLEQYKNPALSGIAQRVSFEQITDIFSFLFVYQPRWDLTTWGYILIWTIIASIATLVTFAIAKSGNKRPYVILLLCCFTVPILIMALGSLPPMQPLFVVRYITHFALMLPLLVGVSLAIVFRNHIKYAVLSTVAFCAILIFGLYNLHGTGNYNFDTLSRPQTRQAAQAIGTCEPGEIVMAGSPLNYFELLYYLPEDCDLRFYSTHPIGNKGGYATIYQSSKQYYDRDPLDATTIYLVYAGQRPELPKNFVKTSSQEFKEYRLDTYERVHDQSLQ